MKAKHTILWVILAAAAVLGGCAANNPGYVTSTQPGAVYGTVESIHLYQASGMNAGTAVGGVLGAAAGSQVGGGKGNTLATIAGAIGGAVAGTAIENHSGSQMYHIVIQLENGGSIAVNQAGSVADLNVGDRVRVYDGHAYRA